jgi:hypothetical protein
MTPQKTPQINDKSHQNQQQNPKKLSKSSTPPQTTMLNKFPIK